MQNVYNGNLLNILSAKGWLVLHVGYWKSQSLVPVLAVIFRQGPCLHGNNKVTPRVI